MLLLLFLLLVAPLHVVERSLGSAVAQKQLACSCDLAALLPTRLHPLRRRRRACTCARMQVPFLASLLQLPLVAPVVQGFLPSLVLLIFLAALPALLLLLIRRGGCQHSTTAVDAQLIQLYFLFQLFAV